MENYKVSVILPIYNAAKYLHQCMDSILSQTLKEIEILCVNDGSTDDSLAILQQYAKKDARIRILTQKNAGAGAARNTGLRYAKGEYLSFLDADDFFEPEMLELAYQKAKEGDARIVVFGSDQYWDDLGEFKNVSWTIRKHALPPYRPMNYRTFTDNVFKVFVGWTWDKLFERAFVLEQGLRFQEQRTSNDLLFVFTAIVTADRIEVLDSILVHQRRNNPESLSNTREKSWWCFYKALMALKAKLIQLGLYYELEQDFINYALHFSLWNLRTIQGGKKRVLFLTLKRKWWKKFGITKHPRSYFYNQSEYREYEEIRKKTWRRYERDQSNGSHTSL
jgi:glycosyltransferase involved in cell wall biosynthesis